MSSLYKYKLFKVKKCFKASKSTETPHPRSGHRIVCDEGNLYSYGGFNPADIDMPCDEVWTHSKPLFKELWKYNFASAKWKKLMCHENMPNELVSIAVTLAPGRVMLIFGGTGVPFGEACSNQLYMCNLLDDLRLVDVEGQIPKMLYGQAMVLDAYGRYLYVVGGTTGFEYFSDIHRFDIRSKRWEEVCICTGNKPSEPQGRYRHELAFDGQKIFVLGGGTATTVFGFQKLSVFNIDLGQWEQLIAQPDPLASPGFPSPRRCHSAVQMGGHNKEDLCVIICGGFNGLEIFSDVWRLELNNLQWKELKFTLPRPVFFHSAAITPAGQMYVFGGIEKLSSGIERRTADVHAIWLRVPTLADMCWDAVIHYTPNLHLFPKNQLLLHGVPHKYVNQICP